MNPLYRMGIEGCYGAGPQWRIWVETKGKSGEEPPQDVKRIIEIREKALRETDEEKRTVLTLEIFKILEENLWVIGALIPPTSIGSFAVVQNRLRNVPSSGDLCAEWTYSIPAQYFIKE